MFKLFFRADNEIIDFALNNILMNAEKIEQVLSRNTKRRVDLFKKICNKKLGNFHKLLK